MKMKRSVAATVSTPEVQKINTIEHQRLRILWKLNVKLYVKVKSEVKVSVNRKYSRSIPKSANILYNIVFSSKSEIILEISESLYLHRG